MQFQDQVVVITGAASGIGACMAQKFQEAGAKVYTIDLNQPCTFQGDLSNPKTLEEFAQSVIDREGKINVLINNALPRFKGIHSASYEDMMNALAVGAAAPFYLTKLLLPYFEEGSSILNISSSRDRMSMPESETYAAAKGAISSLTHALAASLGPKVRVNSISPGWIETKGRTYEGPDVYQHPAGRVGKPDDIAQLALFLASDKAGFITGENIVVDGGMTHLMIYHDENGWTLS